MDENVREVAEKEKEEREEQVALIAGCASGVGLASALAFAGLNYRLVLVEQKEQEDALARCAQLCAERSPKKQQKPLELAVDLAENEQVAKQVIQVTLERFQRLDVLVVNSGAAGGAAPTNRVHEDHAESLPSATPVQETKFDDHLNCIPNYHRIIARNMHASVYLCLAAFEPLRATRGSIVNVSSALDDRPAPFRFAQCMSKAALSMLTKCLARDFAPYVRVNCVSPGPVASSILDDMGASSGSDRPASERARVSSDEQAARMIVYLASKDKAALITGSRVLVDGSSSSSA